MGVVHGIAVKSFKAFMETIARRNRRLLNRLAENEVRHVSIDGRSLEVAGGVFPPDLGEGTALLLEALQQEDLAGLQVLEVGTGSGVLAISAAAAGAEVVATDISPVAFECARENRRRAGFDFEVLLGDLFEPVGPDSAFDLIVFNMPFLEGIPKNMAERSIFDPEYEVTRSFLTQAPGFLKPNGRILVALGDVGSVVYLRYLIDETALERTVAAVRRIDGLRFEAVWLQPRREVTSY